MQVVRSLVIICAILFHIGPSTAASIERMPDGYVLVKVFGETLKFREKDTPYIKLQIQLFDCVKADQGLYYGPTLSRWLNDPKAAECINNSIPDEAPKDKAASVGIYRYPISFSISPTAEDGILYPGGIRIAQNEKQLIKTDRIGPFPTAVLSIGYGNGEPCSDVHARITPSSLGFTKYDSSGYGPGYLINGQFRLDKGLNRSLCVSCGNIIKSACSVAEYSDNKAIIFRFGWDQNKKDSFVVAEPIPEWFRFDQIAREMASKIVISRPEGAFQ